MLKIINIVTDEKFIDDQIDFQDYTIDVATHIYWLIPKKRIGEFRYIKKTDRVIVVDKQLFIKKLSEEKPNAIFLHGLFSIPLELLLEIPRNVKIFWFSWGYDLYDYPSKKPLISLNLYKAKTAQFFKEDSVSLKESCKKIKRFFYIMLSRFQICDNPYTQENRTLIESVVQRIDFYSGVLPIEYDLLKERINIKAQPIVYRYVTPKKFDIREPEYGAVGKNIIIGNSASPINNHVDIMHLIKNRNINIGNRKIYVPLSYGGCDKYIKYVKKHFQNLNENIIYLDTFMAYDKYSEIWNSCGIGIFYSERQHGMGNINSLIQRGAKVFLSETSVTYMYYKKLGLYVYSIQTDLNQKEIDTPLSSQEIQTNRMYIQKIRSKEYLINNLYSIYNKI